MSNFRIQSKSIFLTFSQCDYPLKDFRDNIEKYFGTNLEKGVCCQEKHKDGGLHLHIFPEGREAYARYHGDPDYRLEDEMPAEEAAAVRRSAAAVPYTSADFDRNNDPYYFDKISRASRAAMLAARNI